VFMVRGVIRQDLSRPFFGGGGGFEPRTFGL
jgi:hypothetical protein